MFKKTSKILSKLRDNLIVHYLAVSLVSGGSGAGIYGILYPIHIDEELGRIERKVDDLIVKLKQDDSSLKSSFDSLNETMSDLNCTAKTLNSNLLQNKTSSQCNPCSQPTMCPTSPVPNHKD